MCGGARDAGNGEGVHDVSSAMDANGARGTR